MGGSAGFCLAATLTCLQLLLCCRTELSALGNTSSSLVWLVEPVIPTAPEISYAVVTANLLSVWVVPPLVTGVYREFNAFQRFLNHS